VVFRICARAIQRAGVEHGVAGLELGDVRSDSSDRAGSVAAEDFPAAGIRFDPLAHFRVDGVHRYGADFDEKIATCGLGFGELDVNKRCRIIDRQAILIADGAHRWPPQSCHRPEPGSAACRRVRFLSRLDHRRAFLR
jgi:hypothetical protein